VAELVDAIEAHRTGLDLASRRLRARRLHALADFVAEHGDRGLRSLGGRLAAERWLAQQPPGLDVPSLIGALERQAGGS
jgi:LAO/AO transport system kinase